MSCVFSVINKIFKYKIKMENICFMITDYEKSCNIIKAIQINLFLFRSVVNKRGNLNKWVK